MSAHRHAQDAGLAYSSGSANTTDPGSGGTINLNGSGCFITFASAGDRTVPDAAAGTVLKGYCSLGPVALKNSAGSTIVSVATSDFFEITSIGTASTKWRGYTISTLGVKTIAEAVSYTNSESGLTALNVQEAIDEIDDTVDGL